MLEKTLETSLDCKEIQSVHPKGHQYWIFIRRTDAESEAPILWPPDGKSWLIWKYPDAGKDWGQEEKGITRGWDGWMASPTQWTWVWVNSGSWWWIGRPGVLRFMESQRVGHDWATELNWSVARYKKKNNLSGRSRWQNIRNGMHFLPTNTSKILLHIKQLSWNTYWMLAKDVIQPKLQERSLNNQVLKKKTYCKQKSRTRWLHWGILPNVQRGTDTYLSQNLPKDWREGNTLNVILWSHYYPYTKTRPKTLPKIEN